MRGSTWVRPVQPSMRSRKPYTMPEPQANVFGSSARWKVARAASPTPTPRPVWPARPTGRALRLAQHSGPASAATRSAGLARARRTLGQSAYQRAWEDGHASTLDQAISMAEACRVKIASASSTASALSPRELEVAVLLARGSHQQTGRRGARRSPATARSHVEHILAKLDLHSRAQIGVWASQQGLLTS